MGVIHMTENALERQRPTTVLVNQKVVKVEKSEASAGTKKLYTAAEVEERVAMGIIAYLREHP